MFFAYDQNNSYGQFDIDTERGIGTEVIIEADSAAEANARALEIGLYFDGVDDCGCCGTRWNRHWDDADGSASPTRPYGGSLVELSPESRDAMEAPGAPEPYLYGWRHVGVGYIHYKSGTIVRYVEDNA